MPVSGREDGSLVSSEYAEAYALGFAAGRLYEARRILVMVLDARGLEVSDAVRSRIARCSDVDRLEDWIRRAVVATEGAEVFE